jgi:DNA-binding CsgD family transcriptional regulator
MVRLSRPQEAAHNRIRQLSASGLPPGELSGQILSALLTVMPVDEATLFGIDPDSLLINRLLATMDNGTGGALYWLRHVYLAREPVAELTFPSLMAANLRVIAMRDKPESCWGFPARFFDQLTPREFYHAYHDIGTPAGGGIRAWFEADGRIIAALQMMRMDPGHPIQGSDACFLRLLAPMIGRALGLALRREEALASMDGKLPATGMLVLTPGGSVALQTPAVESWFKMLVDAHPAAIGHQGTPVVVWSAIAALKANGIRNKDVTSTALRVPTSHGTLRVEASPAGEDGTIAVTLSPERSPTPPQLPQSWQVTPQERKVLLLVTQGLSNRQIADRLVVSENTVETHLAHAYEKLGVNSRTQLLARLFQEVYWPLRPMREP